MVFAGFEHTPVAGLQVPARWHWSDAVQTTGFALTELYVVSGRITLAASTNAHLRYRLTSGRSGPIGIYPGIITRRR
ncbi:MAG: hypothetical protein DMD81_10205 [Candidatus Rokuibacteriota bacterium]|nr:MAG: hypothetical protein DMD81_10205 [Candidatus Rokubacteria bacterium]